MEKIELTKREEALLQGDLSVIPEQYYFLKDDEMYLFTDYFQEGIFFAKDCAVNRERDGWLYAYFQNPEKIIKLWYQKFLEEEKEAEKNRTVKENIIYDIDELIQFVRLVYRIVRNTYCQLLRKGSFWIIGFLQNKCITIVCLHL
mgnify:CR=1 FL=1